MGGTVVVQPGKVSSEMLFSLTSFNAVAQGERNLLAAGRSALLFRFCLRRPMAYELNAKVEPGWREDRRFMQMRSAGSHQERCRCRGQIRLRCILL